MKIVLARFSLFLIMMLGIAGSTLVQGNPSATPGQATACHAEVARMNVASLAGPPRETSGSSGSRAVRWQTLLPGAFR